MIVEFGSTFLIITPLSIIKHQVIYMGFTLELLVKMRLQIIMLRITIIMGYLLAWVLIITNPIMIMHIASTLAP